MSRGAALRRPSSRSCGRLLREHGGVPTSLEIRAFTIADEEDLFAAYAATVADGGAFPRRSPVSLDVFRSAWLSGATTVQVARTRGRVVGAYSVRPAFAGLAGHIANGTYLVAREHRRHGYGRALVEHSLAKARRHGFDAMLLNLVLEGNVASRRLWEQAGFRKLGRIPDAVDGEGALIYWRSLLTPAAGGNAGSRAEVCVRAATPQDAAVIAAIFAEAVRGAEGTFEKTPPGPEQFATAMATQMTLVAEAQGAVVGWARLGPYMPSREGIGLYQLYVARSHRGRGIATRLLGQLVSDAEAAGFFKVVGRILTDNEPAIRAARRCGFEEVGVLRRHGQIDGVWCDVLELERLLGNTEDPGATEAHATPTPPGREA